MFYKHVVLTCQQFLSLEQTDIIWNCGVPLQPSVEPVSPLPVSPAPSTKSNSSSITSLLYCYEPMVPIGLFEYEEQSGVSPCASPIANRTSTVIHSLRFKIKVASYPVYCRYRGILARFGGSSVAYQYMSTPRVQYLGGIPVPDTTTILMFCKTSFRDITLERKLNFCKSQVLIIITCTLATTTKTTTTIIRIIIVKVTLSFLSGVSKEIIFSTATRRASTSLSPSPPSISSSSDTASNRGRGRPSKRKRGRPRKDHSVSPMKTDNRPFDSLPLNKKTKLIENGQQDVDEMPMNDISSQKTNGIITNNDITKRSHFSGDKLTHVAQPATVIPSFTSNTISFSANSQDFAQSFTVGSTSGSSLVDSEILVHSLRPRTSLLLPSQFRDKSYDLESDNIKSTNNDRSNASIPVNVDDTMPRPLHTLDQTHNSNSVLSSSVSPMKIGNNVIITKLPIPQPVFKSSKSLSPTDITQDVKELLKAYLSCLQATITSEADNDDTVNTNLETHLVNERHFLDLLFCFMKMRKTPIHRVPRLGSRNCELL